MEDGQESKELSCESTYNIVLSLYLPTLVLVLNDGVTKVNKSDYLRSRKRPKCMETVRPEKHGMVIQNRY